MTGAAGSIVAAITADLATHSGGTFHLLDLAPQPDPPDPQLQAYLTDPNALKPRIAEQLTQSGQKPTPVLIERELARFERLASALAAIRAVEAAGGTAHYHCVDLRDGDAVAAALEQVRAVSGKVDVLLHAAGLEISKPLGEKDRAEFELVFDVKADGWFNLHASDDADRRDGRVQLGRRAVRQRRPDRLLGGEQPAVQARAHAAHPSGRRAASRWTGRRGAASEWPHAARSPRSWPRPEWRCSRRGRDRVDPARADVGAQAGEVVVAGRWG